MGPRIDPFLLARKNCQHASVKFVYKFKDGVFLADIPIRLE